MTKKSKLIVEIPESFNKDILQILGIVPDAICKASGIRNDSTVAMLYNFLRTFFNLPTISDPIPPYKIRDRLKIQQSKISQVLDVISCLSDKAGGSFDHIHSEERKRVLSVISDGQKDVSDFQREFQDNLNFNIQFLKQIEGLYKGAIQTAASEVRGRGKQKPKRLDDYLFIKVCQLYEILTDEPAEISCNPVTGKASGRFITYLEYVLPQMGYPLETTHWALEKRIRELKSIKTYFDNLRR